MEVMRRRKRLSIMVRLRRLTMVTGATGRSFSHILVTEAILTSMGKICIAGALQGRVARVRILGWLEWMGRLGRIGQQEWIRRFLRPLGWLGVIGILGRVRIQTFIWWLVRQERRGRLAQRCCARRQVRFNRPTWMASLPSRNRALRG